MPQINIDGVEYVKKEDTTIKKEDTRHPGRYWYPESFSRPHYYINSSSQVARSDSDAINSAKIGNAFETRQEAEKELEKRKAIVTIKRYISDTFGVFEPDWSDSLQKKYFIIYNYDINEFLYGFNHSTKMYSPIGYFSYRDHAKEIREKFYKELRIIFDIE